MIEKMNDREKYILLPDASYLSLLIPLSKAELHRLCEESKRWTSDKKLFIKQISKLTYQARLTLGAHHYKMFMQNRYFRHEDDPWLLMHEFKLELCLQPDSVIRALYEELFLK